MNKYTVIIPISPSFKEEESLLLINALKSITNVDVEIFINVPTNVKQLIENIVYNLKDELVQPLTVNIASGSTTIQGQINEAVNMINTEYFTVLEFDDMLEDTWFISVQDYSKNEETLYLPLTRNYDTNGVFIGLSNEEPWSASFSEELGYIDMEILKEYPRFRPSGMVMKTETFKEIGGLKENILIAFWYEFLLRVRHNGVNIFVVPKFGYKHILEREGSFDYNVVTNTKQEEIDFYYSKCLEEYYFKDDRKFDVIIDEDSDESTIIE